MQLAKQLEVSRATVRTALHQLTVEGLIVQMRYTGWSVMTLTAHDAWELYTLRASLEGLAARLAARSLNDAGRAVLERAFRRLSTASERGSWAKTTAADFGLRKTIARSARSGPGQKCSVTKARLVHMESVLFVVLSEAKDLAVRR